MTVNYFLSGDQVLSRLARQIIPGQPPLPVLHIPARWRKRKPSVTEDHPSLDADSCPVHNKMPCPHYPRFTDAQTEAEKGSCQVTQLVSGPSEDLQVRQANPKPSPLPDCLPPFCPLPENADEHLSVFWRRNIVCSDSKTYSLVGTFLSYFFLVQSTS